MATKFSMKDPNPGVWFPFDEEDPESGEICIRAINERQRSKIQKAAIKTKEKYKHGQRYEIRDVNDELFSRMTWDYVIADWVRLEDDDGNPIDCTTDNKVFLMQSDPGFAAFVNQCLEKVNEDIESRVTAQKKTSSKEPNADETSRPATDAESLKGTDSTNETA